MKLSPACFKKGAELGIEALHILSLATDHETHMHVACARVCCTDDPMAHLSLAVCYSQGKGVEESIEKAFEHHQEASKSGNY